MFKEVRAALVVISVLICAIAMAGNAPTVNPAAILTVRHINTGPVPLGRGVVLQSSFATSGEPYIAKPAGADAQVFCVTYRTSPDDTTAGLCVQLGLSNVQVRVGGSSVSAGDKLNIQDNTGVWQAAPALAQNVYLVALQDCASGSACWAAPVASRSL